MSTDRELLKSVREFLADPQHGMWPYVENGHQTEDMHDWIARIDAHLAKPQPEIKYGIDWGKHGDRSCCTIMKILPDGTAELIASEFGPAQPAAAAMEPVAWKLRKNSWPEMDWHYSAQKREWADVAIPLYAAPPQEPSGSINTRSMSVPVQPYQEPAPAQGKEGAVLKIARRAISSIGSFDQGLQTHYQGMLDEALRAAKDNGGKA